jgi:hypothetical protein
VDVIRNRDSPLIDEFKEAAFDGRNLLTAVAIDLGIHLIDLHNIASFYWRAGLGTENLGKDSPVNWDWTTRFLSDPSSHTLYRKNLLLILVAYPSQFLIVLFAISLIIILFRHNVFFLDAIFLRSKADGKDPTSFIVLDLDDKDERFGLSPLSGQFNSQIGLLSLTAGFTLISRWVNSDFKDLQSFITGIRFTGATEPLKLIPDILNHSGHAFLTAGQVMFPVAWLLMFLVVMLPASAKWLPLRYVERIDGGAAAFLRELLPPGNPDENMATNADVTRVAGKFACQPFWPVGNGRAEALSIGAFFVFFVLLAPIVPTTPWHFLYYGELLVVAFAISKVLFFFFRYRLYAFDRRLVQIPKPD